mmetsp:Transcript_13776/g.32145  ORF Transcript_13776/g.32145 Transcript_13776/m.32145 type:complete len:241 (+) Transcript_13776:693-1415(+)
MGKTPGGRASSKARKGRNQHGLSHRKDPGHERCQQEEQRKGQALPHVDRCRRGRAQSQEGSPAHCGTETPTSGPRRILHSTGRISANRRRNQAMGGTGSQGPPPRPADSKEIPQPAIRWSLRAFGARNIRALSRSLLVSASDETPPQHRSGEPSSQTSQGERPETLPHRQVHSIQDSPRGRRTSDDSLRRFRSRWQIYGEWCHRWFRSLVGGRNRPPAQELECVQDCPVGRSGRPCGRRR